MSNFFIKIFYQKIKRIEIERREESERLRKQFHDQNEKQQQQHDAKIEAIQALHKETLASTVADQKKLQLEIEKGRA